MRWPRLPDGNGPGSISVHLLVCDPVDAEAAALAVLAGQAAGITEAIQERIDTAAKEMEASVDAARLCLVRAAGTTTSQPLQSNDAYWESFKTEGLALVAGSD